MRFFKYIGIILIGFVIICNELFCNDREIMANYITTKPLIDGKLDDEVWENGVWFTDFVLTSDIEKLAEVQTEFQIAYDEDNLYLAARMYEPEPGQLKIGEFRRDGAISQDDHLELMIGPSGNRQEYFHFGINAVGIQYDAKQNFGGEFYDVEWNTNWQAATKIGSRQWTVELAIPFSGLSLTKDSKSEWHMNVARQRCVGKQKELSSFSPMKGTFYCFPKFSKLIFPKEVFDKFYWKIKGPIDYHLGADKGDWILGGKVQIDNGTSENKKFKLLFKQINQKGAMVAQVITDTLANEGKKEYAFKLPVERQEPLQLQIEIVNDSNVKEIYRSKRVMLNVSYDLMDLEMLSPWYRNNIYFTEHIPELKLLVNLSLAQKVLTGSKLYLKLMGEKTKNVVSELELRNLTRLQEVNFPLGDIAHGNYILEGQVIDSQGALIAQSMENLKKLRNDDNEWRLKSTGALLHNGVPFLPQGWFKILPDEQSLNNYSIYNAVFMPIDLIQDEEKIKKYLDSIQKANAYAIVYPYVSDAMVNSAKHLGRLLIGSEIQAIQQRIKILKKHPAVMGWIIADQPELNSILPERLKQLYSIIKEEDPFHPVIMVNSGLKGIVKYWGMADITVVTAFIPFIKEDEMATSIDWTSYYLDVANKITRNKVSFWVGLQTYDCANDYLESKRLLSFVELRNLFYQAVIGGVKGFFWHDYQYVYNYPELKLSADYLARELYLLKDAILAPKINENVIVKSNSKNGISLSQKIMDKDQYLFVVNTSPKKQTVKFESLSFEKIDRLFVLAENRIVRIKNNEFEDEFEPYATHIYSTKEHRGEFSSLSDIEQAIDSVHKARKKEGNLAFADSGIKITASSYNEISSLNSINDGVIDGLLWKTEGALPQWIEMNWPSPVRVEKILLFSDTIEHAKVQAKENGNWVTMGEFVRRSGSHLRAIFPEKELKQLRILITEKKPSASSISLSEIEVYNRLTKVSF